MMDAAKKPRVTVMGKEVDWDDFPDPPPVEAAHVFAKVELTPLALNRASQLVPQEYWKKMGLYTWLDMKANEAFQAMPVSARVHQIGRLKYVFEYTAKGPALKTVVL